MRAVESRGSPQGGGRCSSFAQLLFDGACLLGRVGGPQSTFLSPMPTIGIVSYTSDIPSHLTPDDMCEKCVSSLGPEAFILH